MVRMASHPVEEKALRNKFLQKTWKKDSWFPPQYPWSKTTVSLHTEASMPIHIFTEAERATLDTFPAEITQEDLITFFTLSEADKAQLPIYSAPYNRLGFALQLCTLRFMGFVPEDVMRIPPAIVEYVAEQITVEPVLVKYGTRVQTRTDHAQLV